MKERRLQINDKETLLTFPVFAIIIGCFTSPVLIKPEITTVLSLDPFVSYLIEMMPSGYEKISRINNEEFALYLFQFHAAMLAISFFLIPISLITTFFVLWRYANVAEMKKFRDRRYKEFGTPEHIERTYSAIRQRLWLLPGSLIIKNLVVKLTVFNKKYPRILASIFTLLVFFGIFILINLPTFVDDDGFTSIANNNILGFFVYTAFCFSMLLVFLIDRCIYFWIYIYPKA